MRSLLDEVLSEDIGEGVVPRVVDSVPKWLKGLETGVIDCRCHKPLNVTSVGRNVAEDIDNIGILLNP